MLFIYEANLWAPTVNVSQYVTPRIPLLFHFWVSMHGSSFQICGLKALMLTASMLVFVFLFSLGAR
ncbi:hypothetical protein OG21DRAFT_1218503 [Imleria badia]|nr:hypothetical protein OG21DRAFT_1218503 [Imleria badia]